MKKLIILLIFILPLSLGAQSLTTFFAANNGGAPGGGVYYDLTIGPNDVTITGLDLNTQDLAGAAALNVYTRVGTFAGNETSMVGWTLVTTGTGIGAGPDNPTAITLVNPFTLSAGTTYGIALGLTVPGVTGHIYTNGTGANEVHANADLTLTAGSANNVALSSGVFSPRVWNGTIYYTVGPAVLVPTMGEWGLIILGMFILIFGIVAIRYRRRQTSVT